MVRKKKFQEFKKFIYKNTQTDSVSNTTTVDTTVSSSYAFSVAFFKAVNWKPYHNNNDNLWFLLFLFRFMQNIFKKKKKLK